MMCGKNTPYVQKFFGGCVIIMSIVIIIMAVFISNSGCSKAKVELNAHPNSAELKPHPGHHLALP